MWGREVQGDAVVVLRFISIFEQNYESHEIKLHNKVASNNKIYNFCVNTFWHNFKIYVKILNNRAFGFFIFIFYNKFSFSNFDVN